MIINSHFRDYYDFFANQYRDEKIVYNRKTEQFNPRKNPELLSFIKQHTWDYIKSRRVNGNWVKEGEVSLLLIAGRVFPFAPLPNYEPGYDFNDPYKVYRESKWYERLNKSVLPLGKRHPKAIKFCQEIAPILVFAGGRYPVIIKNPKLKHYSPPISTWEIYQELMQILAANEPNVPEMDNKTKVEIHGFDKYSFRPTSRK